MMIYLFSKNNIRYYIIHIIFYILTSFIFLGISSNFSKKIGKFNSLIAMGIILFLMLIYLLKGLNFEKIIEKKLFFMYTVLQLFTFLGVVDISFSASIGIFDWRYYLITFIFMNINVIKLFKLQLGLSILGHIFIIYNSLMFNIILIRGLYNFFSDYKYPEFINYFYDCNNLELLYMFIIFSIVIVYFFKYYSRRKELKDDLIIFNKAMYYWYIQLFTIFTLIKNYWQ